MYDAFKKVRWVYVWFIRWNVLKNIFVISLNYNIMNTDFQNTTYSKTKQSENYIIHGKTFGFNKIFVFKKEYFVWKITSNIVCELFDKHHFEFLNLVNELLWGKMQSYL